MTFDNFGVIEEHETLEGFSDSKRLLDREENLKLVNGEKVVAKIPISRKKSFSVVVLIPSANKYCSDCEKNVLYDNCDKLVNQTKEFAANLNEIK